MILNDFGLEGNDSPRHHRGDGAGDAAHADAARRSARHEARAGDDGRPGPLLHGGAPDGRRRRTPSSSLVSRYPDTPNVHYAYGVFLLAEQPDKAIEVFKRELKVSPQNVYAQAADRLRLHPQAASTTRRCRGPRMALPRRRPSSWPATRSARCCSRPATSRAPCRARGRRRSSPPDSPIMHFALASAYRARRPDRRRRKGAAGVHSGSTSCSARPAPAASRSAAFRSTRLRRSRNP